MQNTTQTVWVITEGIAGTENQCLGVAEALSTRLNGKVTIVTKRVNLRFPYSLWSPFLSIGEGPGMLTPTSSPIAPPWPDIVIAGGRKAIGIARYIRKASLGRTFVCVVQHPRVRFDDFDLVALPWHDLKGPQNCHPGQASKGGATRDPHQMIPQKVPDKACGLSGMTIQTNGAPNRVTTAWLNIAREKWREVMAPLPGPRTAVLIGGNSKHHRLGTATMDRLIKHIKELHTKRGGSLMITVSRRTPEDLRERLAASFNLPLKGGGVRLEADGGGDHSLYTLTSPHPNPPPQGGREYTALPAVMLYTGTGDNPYAGFLAYADYIVVTTDSTSMISDAATVGKPVEFFPLPGGSKRNDKFLAHCRDLGVDVPGTSYTPWRDADRVAEQILRMIK